MIMSRTAGFTLLELIIVIVIIGIITVPVGRMISSGFEAYLTGKNISEADWQGQLGLERMVRDIREIRSSGSITTASSTQLIFTNFSGSSVTYQLTGSNLMRNSQVLAHGIQTLTFSYFDQNGASTLNIPSIRFVTVTINVTQSNANFSITTSLFPRNLG